MTVSATLLDRLRGIERIPYQHRGAWPNSVAVTPCPHGGAWWARDSFLQMRKPGTRVPAKVGTNACAHCIFNAETDYDHVKCRFLLASQRTTNKLLAAVQ